MAEIEGNTVHAVSQASRGGAVFEDVAEVPFALRAVGFHSLHAICPVDCRFDRAGKGGEKARPPRSALKLRFRCEKLPAAPGAGENPFPVLTIQRARARPLGPVLTKDLILFGRQPGAPLIVVLRSVHPANLPDSIDSKA